MAEASLDAPGKACTRCGCTRPATLEFFSPKKAAPDGLQVWCKPCCSEQKREYRRKHPERIAAARARYVAANSEKIREAQRAGHAARLDARKASQAEYRARTKDARNERRRKLNAECPEYRERRLEQVRRSRSRDPERTKTLRAAWWARRTPLQKLRTLMSNVIRDSLKGRRKGAGWQSLVGYSVQELKVHLERQFLPGMTWENHGPVWHVDHIVPVASFAIASSSCPEFHACWAMTNLRPLWAQENLSKRASRLYLL